jgi:hypothetical protein
MKRAIASKVGAVMCLCLWLSSATIGHDTAGGWSWLSLPELEQKSSAQLQKDKARLRGLMANVDPFTQRPDTWKMNFDDLTKAKLIGEIVELQYLARALQIDNAQVVEKHPEIAEFKLDKDPVRITIVQRTAKGIPGFPAAVKIDIDDITAGQVLLEIYCEGIPKPVVDTISVRVGDVTQLPQFGCG